MTTIQPGQTLTARSACNYDCVFSAHVVARKGQFATVTTAMNGTKRVKIHNDGETEFVFALGRYSMAPVFRAR
jgi:hypothetical protein